MSNTKETIGEKLLNLCFEIFYIALFVLQMLPSLAICLLGCNNPISWAACVVGVATMVIQSIKFPCALTMFWRSAMIAATLAVIIVF